MGLRQFPIGSAQAKYALVCVAWCVYMCVCALDVYVVRAYMYVCLGECPGKGKMLLFLELRRMVSGGGDRNRCLGPESLLCTG